jgi:hypothetical protein
VTLVPSVSFKAASHRESLDKNTFLAKSDCLLDAFAIILHHFHYYWWAKLSCLKEGCKIPLSLSWDYQFLWLTSYLFVAVVN